MEAWRFEVIREAFEAFRGPEDPNDPKAKKRKRIVDAATALFIRHGYKKTSIDQVAEAAGVAKGTVYLYFETKADLLVRAVVEEKGRYLDRIAPVLAPEVPPKERLRQWLRIALVTATEMPLVSRLLSGESDLVAAHEEMSADLREKTESFQLAFLSSMIDQAAAPHRWTREELEDRARVLLGFFHFGGLLQDDRLRRGLTMERFAGILADMLVDGVAFTKPDRQHGEERT